ncbi:MAG: NUDIX hydrolase [Candidatus Kerfeldbacteria bacterium]|nr:NUDIX hydrolase [Candidatus Kerfeldbacteria bacterium]
MGDQSYEDIKHAAALALNRVDPTEPFGSELFLAVARVSITTCVESVCLRWGDNGRVEVLLAKRDPEDPAYPSMWHCPGTAMRVGETIQDMFDRLAKREYWTKVKSYRFVGFDNNQHEARGHFIHLVYLTELDVMSGHGTGKDQWFGIEQLPDGIVDHHRTTIIPMAVRKFRGE